MVTCNLSLLVVSWTTTVVHSGDEEGYGVELRSKFILDDDGAALN